MAAAAADSLNNIVGRAQKLGMKAVVQAPDRIMNANPTQRLPLSKMDSVMKAAQKKAKDDARKGIVSEGPSLRPAAETGLVDPAADARAAAAAAAEPGAEPVPGKPVADKDVFSADVFSDADVEDED